MTPETFYQLTIVWLWVSGGGLLWMFLDDLVPECGRGWRMAALLMVWPIALPTVLSWYCARTARERA